MTILSGFWDAFSSMRSILYLKWSKGKHFNYEHTKRSLKKSFLFLFSQFLKERFTFGAPSSSLPFRTPLHSWLHQTVSPKPQKPPWWQPNGHFGSSLSYHHCSPPPLKMLIILTLWPPFSLSAFKDFSRSSFHSEHPCWASSLVYTALITIYAFISSTALLLIHIPLLGPKMYIQDPHGHPLGCSPVP